MLITINEKYRLLREQRARDLSAETRSGAYSSSFGFYGYEQAFIDSFWSPMTKAGSAVTEEMALTVSAVYACNRVLADSIAAMPLSLFRKDDDGGVEEATDRHEHVLMSLAPSSLYTA